MPKKGKRSKFLSAVAGFFGWMISNGFGVIFTVTVFLALPLLQQIAGGKKQEAKTTQAAVIDAPQEIEIEEEKPPEPETEPEETPEIEQTEEPISLSDISNLLNSGAGTGDGAAVGNALRNAISDKAGSLLSGGGVEQPPRAVSQSAPRYPADLHKKGITGVVRIEMTIDANGRVRNPEVVESTHPGFRQPALTAVRQWKYEPGLRGGTPAPFKVRIPIKFG
ncbi:MAG: energy transducer TonB [Verrucomicrobiota bacterium]